MSEAVFEERFIKLVEDNGGFEYYQAYRNDVDLILGGKGDTFWYVVTKKGKVTESYIGKYAGGVWEDVYVKGRNLFSNLQPSSIESKRGAELVRPRSVTVFRRRSPYKGILNENPRQRP